MDYIFDFTYVFFNMVSFKSDDLPAVDEGRIIRLGDQFYDSCDVDGYGCVCSYVGRLDVFPEGVV